MLVLNCVHSHGSGKDQNNGREFNWDNYVFHCKDDPKQNTEYVFGAANYVDVKIPVRDWNEKVGQDPRNIEGKDVNFFNSVATGKFIGIQIKK